MWRMRYWDNAFPHISALHWFRSKEEGVEWAKTSGIDEYELRYVHYPPKGYYEPAKVGQPEENDELTNAVAFMNRWAQHTVY